MDIFTFILGVFLILKPYKKNNFLSFRKFYPFVLFVILVMSQFIHHFERKREASHFYFEFLSMFIEFKTLRLF